MTRLEWGVGKSPFVQGVDHGVLYLDEGAVPWNGLVSVTEVETGSVDVSNYFDGVRLAVVEDIGDFRGTIEAYTYPDVFAEYNGYSEREIYKRFGLSYRTEKGDGGHLLHLVYNALIMPTELAWKTVAAQVDPSLFTWNAKAEPERVLGARPTAHMILDTEDMHDVTSAIQDVLYGTDTTEPRLMTPDELVELYESATTLRITYHADGSYTASGPSDVLEIFDDGSFLIKAPTAQPTSAGSFQVSSY